jgi:hypothetical protein
VTARKFAKVVLKLFKNIFMDHLRAVGHCIQTVMVPHLKIIVIFGTNIWYKHVSCHLPVFG